MTGRYGSEDAALRRDGILRQKGTWPGTVRCADGTYRLTYDPQDATEAGE